VHFGSFLLLSLHFNFRHKNDLFWILAQQMKWSLLGLIPSLIWNFLKLNILMSTWHPNGPLAPSIGFWIHQDYTHSLLHPSPWKFITNSLGLQKLQNHLYFASQAITNVQDLFINFFLHTHCAIVKFIGSILDNIFILD